MSNSSSVSSYIRNFPLTTLRENQGYILNEIDSAFSSGYKYIILEAPTGTGKSPIAIATGLSLGTSYKCVPTKDLQTQYSKDFSFLREAIGKNNFVCNVRERSHQKWYLQVCIVFKSYRYFRSGQLTNKNMLSYECRLCSMYQ